MSRGFGTSPLFVDLTAPIKAAFEWFMNQLLAGVEALFSVLIGGFVTLLEQFIHLDPEMLLEMETIWNLSLSLYFGLLTLAALSVLGLVQIFPSASEMDPYRLAERGFAATLALFVINPPGGSESLFGKGLFAWSFVVVNGIQDLFLDHIGDGIEFSVSMAGIASGLGSVAALVAIGYFMGLTALASIAMLMILLGLRKIVIFGVYALFPLLILFWVVDVGPPKYANQVAGMAFKAAGILLIAGILVAGLIAASGTIIESTAADSSQGNIEMAGGGAAGDVAAGDASGGEFASTDEDLADNSGAVAEMLTVVIAVVAMAFGGSTIMGISFATAGLGSLMGGAKRGIAKLGGKTRSKVSGGDGGASAGGDAAAAAGAAGAGAAAANAADGGGSGRSAPGAASSSVSSMQSRGDDLTNPSAMNSASDAPSGGPMPTAPTMADLGDGPERSGPTDIDFSDIEDKQDFEEQVGGAFDDQQTETMYAMYEDLSESDNSYLKGAASSAASGAISGAVGGAAAGPAGIVAGAVAGGTLGAARGVGGTAVKNRVPGSMDELKATTAGHYGAAKSTVNDMADRFTTTMDDLSDGVGSGDSGSTDEYKYD